MLKQLIAASALCAGVVGCGNSGPEVEASKKLTPQAVLSEYARDGKKVVESKFDEVKPNVFMGYVVIEGGGKTYFALMNEDTGLGVSTTRMSWNDGPKALEQVIAERDAHEQTMTQKMSSRKMSVRRQRNANE